MEEVRKYTVSFGYLWRIGVLDFHRINHEPYKDEEDGLWKYKSNPKYNECYMQESDKEIEVYKPDVGLMDLTNKGRKQAIDILSKYDLLYNEKYLERIGDV